MLNKESNFSGGIEISKILEPLDATDEVLLKYKSNDREMKRERRAS